MQRLVTQLALRAHEIALRQELADRYEHRERRGGERHAQVREEALIDL